MIVLGINHQCNFNCLFCLDKNDRNLPVPSYQELEKLFAEIKKTGANDIMFMKGESLIRADFLKILKCARHLGLNVKITTNGSMLSYCDFFKKIIAGGVSQINLSIHSHVPKIANAIAGNKQCHHLQKQALKNINVFMKDNTDAGKQLKININTVVNELNYRHLDGLASYLKENLSCTCFRIKYKIVQKGSMDIALYKKVLPSLFDIKPYIFKCIDILKSKHIEKNIAFNGFPLCFLPFYEWAAIEVQQVLLHNDLYLDEYHVKNFDDVLRQSYRHHARCRGCGLISLCPGFLNDYLDIYPDFVLRTSKKKINVILKNIRQKLA